MPYFYKCSSCRKTFPAFDNIEACPLCGSPQISESPELGLGKRFERGVYYEVDLRTGKAKQATRKIKLGY